MRAAVVLDDLIHSQHDCRGELGWGRSMQSEEPPMKTGETGVSSYSTSAGGAENAAPGTRRCLPLWLVSLGAGLLAGALSACAGEASSGAFALHPHFPANYNKISGYERMAVRSDVLREAYQVVETKRGAAAYGALGLFLGVAMAVAGGIAGGSIRSALIRAVVGGAAGGAAGAAFSLAFIPLFFRFLDPENGLILLFLTHAAIFAVIGAAGGVALGWGLGGPDVVFRCLIGGLFGAFFGAFAFETINSLAYPLLRKFEPVPAARIPRLVVHFCVAAGTALLAGLAAGDVSRQSSSASANG